MEGGLGGRWRRTAQAQSFHLLCKRGAVPSASVFLNPINIKYSGAGAGCVRDNRAERTGLYKIKGLFGPRACSGKGGGEPRSPGRGGGRRRPPAPAVSRGCHNRPRAPRPSRRRGPSGRGRCGGARTSGWETSGAGRARGSWAARALRRRDDPSPTLSGPSRPRRGRGEGPPSAPARSPQPGLQRRAGPRRPPPTPRHLRGRGSSDSGARAGLGAAPLGSPRPNQVRADVGPPRGLSPRPTPERLPEQGKAAAGGTGSCGRGAGVAGNDSRWPLGARPCSPAAFGCVWITGAPTTG